jgi:hypothetical protein
VGDDREGHTERAPQAGTEASERQRGEEVDRVRTVLVRGVDDPLVHGARSAHAPAGLPEDAIRDLLVNLLVAFAGRGDHGQIVRIEALAQIREIRLDASLLRREVVRDEEMAQC